MNSDEDVLGWKMRKRKRQTFISSLVLSSNLQKDCFLYFWNMYISFYLSYSAISPLGLNWRWQTMRKIWESAPPNFPACVSMFASICVVL